jgi:hypothetical protein
MNGSLSIPLAGHARHGYGTDTDRVACFFGRKVFFAIESQNTSGGLGPYVAY